MASQANLESSLRRCARLGLDVLERASRRSVDWTSNPSETPTQETDEGDSTHTTLDDALESIAEFMTQTTHQCKKFYLDPTHKATENERAHVCRYHSHQRPLALHLGPENTRSSWDQRSSTLRCLQEHTA